jgi:hypothetical protein
VTRAPCRPSSSPLLDIVSRGGRWSLDWHVVLADQHEKQHDALPWQDRCCAWLVSVAHGRTSGKSSRGAETGWLLGDEPSRLVSLIYLQSFVEAERWMGYVVSGGDRGEQGAPVLSECAARSCD